jgi:hypothetical protein
MSEPTADWRAAEGAADEGERARSFGGDDMRYVATNAPADTTAYSFQVIAWNVPF